MEAELGRKLTPEERREVYNRGQVPLGGGMVARTFGANPFTTLTGATSALGGEGGIFGNSLGAITALTNESYNPFVKPILEQAAARNLFTDDDFSAPASENVQSFGGDAMNYNEATGKFERDNPRPNFIDHIARNLPGISSVRQGLVGNDFAYDTANTWDLARYRMGLGGDRETLLGTRTSPPVYESPSVFGEPSGLTEAVLSYLGTSVKSRDAAEEDRKFLKRLGRESDAILQTDKRRKKAGIGEGAAESTIKVVESKTTPSKVSYR